MLNLQALDLHSTELPSSLLLALLRAAPNLRQLELSGTRLPDCYGARIAEFCPQLESFGADQALGLGDVCYVMVEPLSWERFQFTAPSLLCLCLCPPSFYLHPAPADDHPFCFGQLQESHALEYSMASGVRCLS
jgi:hypothetical protein